MTRPWQRAVWLRSSSTILVVGALLCLAALNVYQRATWSEVEDGVLWRSMNGAVVAAEIAPGTAGERAGIRKGDILLAIQDKEVVDVADVVEILHAGAPGMPLRYLVAREHTREQPTIEVQPIPSSPRGMYFALAAVGIFSLLVGVSVGCAGRITRRRSISSG
jgi:membrane-associated protease RseP (regulator of RpoE activity)